MSATPIPGAFTSGAFTDGERGTPVVAVVNATKEHPGNVRALREASLEVGPGELVAISGPSGSGNPPCCI